MAKCPDCHAEVPDLAGLRLEDILHFHKDGCPRKVLPPDFLPHYFPEGIAGLEAIDGAPVRPPNGDSELDA